MPSSTPNQQHMYPRLLAAAIAVAAVLAYLCIEPMRQAMRESDEKFRQEIQERSRKYQEIAEAWEKKCLETLHGEVFVPVPGRSQRFCIPKGTILAIEE